MKLLVFTQKIDRNDTVLGFFHDWVVRISHKYSSVEIICLETGEYSFDDNVKVHKIGKGYGFGKLKYIYGVYKYLFLLHGKYDKVFIHMNQEYVFSLGLYWKIAGIPVYLWRNHPKGNFITQMAVALSTKVFCTSTKSYTARFKKTVIMPAGINTEIFKSENSSIKKKYSICMVGRISPVKHVELALESMNILMKEGVQATLEIIGDAPEIDKKYFEYITRYVDQNNLAKIVTFTKGVPPSKLPEVYGSYELCLNLTEAGSFDKTIVEATSCGTIPLVSSSSFSGLLPGACITETSPEAIASSIKRLLDPIEQIKIQKDLEKFVESQNLDSLMSKLFTEMK